MSGHSHQKNGVDHAEGFKATQFQKELNLIGSIEALTKEIRRERRGRKPMMSVLKSIDGRLELLVEHFIGKTGQAPLAFDEPLPEPVEEAAAPVVPAIPPPLNPKGVDLTQHVDEWGKALKPRWREPMKRADVVTLQQVVNMEDGELRKISRLGTDGLASLKKILALLGLETATDRLLEMAKHESPALPPVR